MKHFVLSVLALMGGGVAGLFAQGTDLGELNALAAQMHSGYANRNMDAVFGLWNERSPERAGEKAELTKLLAADVSVVEKTVNEPELEGRYDFVRIERDIYRKSANSNDAHERKALMLQCVKEHGRWTIWREMTAAQGVAELLIGATDEEQKGRLRQRYQDVAGSEVAAALLDRGTEVRHAGELDRADRIYRLALTMADEAGAPKQHALAINNLGLTQYERGEYSGALGDYERSLAISRGANDDVGVARTLNNIGVVHDALGEMADAHENYQASLTLGEKTGNDRLIGNALTNLGILNARQGNYVAAFASLSRSYELDQRSKNQRGIAISLINIGNVFLYQGDKAQAEDCFQRSLALAEENGLAPLKATALLGLGRVKEFDGKFGPAIQTYENALELLNQTGQKAEAAQAMGFIASAHSWNKEPAKPLEFYAKALDLQSKLNDSRDGGMMLSQMAAAYNRQGSFADGLRTAAQAKERAEKSGSDEVLWRSQVEAGIADMGLGKSRQAEVEFTRSIEIIEKIRLNLAGAEAERESYLESRLSPYHKMLDILVASGRDAEAFQYAEKVRARVLMDIFRSERTQRPDVMSEMERGQDHDLRMRLSSLNTKLNRARGEGNQSAISEIGKEVNRARLDYAAFETGLYARHPEWKLQSGDLVPLSLESFFRSIPGNDTAFVEFVVTDSKLYSFVLTNEANSRTAAKLKIQSVPLNYRDLAAQVRKFREQLASRDLSFRANARELYETLLGPVAADLAEKRNLVIIPDSFLWELPMQALVNKRGEYVMDKFAISYAPSLTALALMTDAKRRLNQADHKRELLAFGNPTWNPTGRASLTAFYRDQNLGDLPHAEDEVRRIGSIYGKEQSNVYIRTAAREKSFSTEASDAKVIHLATHGILNDASPLYSQLLLAPESDGTEDGVLEAWELLRMHLRAELVILSACETARGSVGDGEGVIGLSWALLVAGAPTAVLSQWKVQSESTSQLMIDFHENRRSGMDEANALRSAALAVRKTPQYEHPFYWAPFVVIGATHF